MTAPIAKCRLDEWKRKTDAATEGMRCDGYCVVNEDGNSLLSHNGRLDVSEFWEVADAEFLAMARTAMPLLLDEVERLAKFEPPVCEQCGYYKEKELNSHDSGFEWMCEECE